METISDVARISGNNVVAHSVGRTDLRDKKVLLEERENKEGRTQAHRETGNNFHMLLTLLLALIVIWAYYEMAEEGPGRVLIGYLLFAVAVFTGWLFWHFIIRS